MLSDKFVANHLRVKIFTGTALTSYMLQNVKNSKNSQINKSVWGRHSEGLP